MAGFFLSPDNMYLSPIAKEVGLIQIQLKVMSKISKNIMRWVFMPYILPLRLDHNLTKVLLWNSNMWLLHSCCLIFDHPSMPIQVWQSILPNQSIQIIICLNIIICLPYVLYNIHHLIPKYPKVCCVSYNNLYTEHTLLNSRIATPDFSEGGNYRMWSDLCQSFLKNWPLSFEKTDPCITPN